MPEPRVIHEGALSVFAVADRLELEPKMLGHDLRADTIQRVVPRKRPELRPGSVPPQDAHGVETREARSCSLRTREVELEQLLGGKDPMLV
jgi:hypothetical protein